MRELKIFLYTNCTYISKNGKVNEILNTIELSTRESILKFSYNSHIPGLKYGESDFRKNLMINQ